MIDIQLTDGDLPEVSRFVTGIPLVLQRVQIRLRTFLGEWVLDIAQGLPYLAWRAQKPPDLPAIAARVRAELATTPGVVRVDRCTASLEVTTRLVRVEAQAVITDGTTAAASAELIIEMGGNTSPAIISAKLLAGGGIIP